MILVVEDEDMIAAAIEGMCAQLGETAQVTRLGREALGLAATHVFRIAIVDLRLPDIKGVDLIVSIRALPEPYGTVPILAASGEMQRVLRDALKAGANGVIDKPYHLNVLKARVEQLMRA